ncbi:MAG: dihydroneopterin aldolase [Anaerolineales bacterium]|nr:dihydroneopterin aldolase [Anaerolineales bacterium]
MLDKIFIQNLAARCIIGIHPWESETPQEIRIHITLEADLRKAGESDEIADTISYSEVARKVLAHAETAERLTVEALAGDIARLCLEDPRVQSVGVRVEKPAAVPEAQSVGVEIERRQGDF